VSRVALEGIGSMTEAISLTVKGSGLAPKEVADRLGIEVRHLNRMLNRWDSRHFPPDMLVRLMEECRSLLPLEWLAWKMGYCLHERSLGDILAAIRDAMVTVGATAPRFAICDNGRVVRVGGDDEENADAVVAVFGGAVGVRLDRRV